MVVPLPSSRYSHEESITLSPYNNHVIVRLQVNANLNESGLSKNDENLLARPTTPFPTVLIQLLQNYGISRLFLSTGSSSSTFYDDSNVLQDEYSMGPSGIVLKLERKQQQSFQLSSLLQVLQGHRLLLAPLNAVFQSRLHRHVHVSRSENGTEMLQINLPLVDSAVAFEGVRDFLKIGRTGNGGGLFATQHVQSLSHVLLGDSTSVQVSSRERRTMWLNVQATCNTDKSNSCNYTLQQGIQYGVVLPGDSTSTKLSQFIPFTDFQECSVSTQKTRLTIVSSNSESIIEDWNMDILVKIPSTQTVSTTRHSLYGNRILERPNGVANTGRIVTRIGASLDCTTTAQVVEVLPPFIRPLWDTWSLQTTALRPILSVSLQTTSIKPLLSLQPDGTIVVQYNVTIPAKLEWQVSLDYEPVLLPFQQFPADPNRGMELPPTQFTFFENPECLPTSVTLFSSPLLFMPPVPDMSMPFNVISLTCTLYAFVIGSLANLLVRKASARIRNKLKPPPETKLQKLKRKLKGKLNGLVGRKEAGDELGNGNSCSNGGSDDDARDSASILATTGNNETVGEVSAVEGGDRETTVR